MDVAATCEASAGETKLVCTHVLGAVWWLVGKGVDIGVEGFT